jgi:Family of unknown function (DUF6278)
MAAWLATQGRSLEETPETITVVDGLLDDWAVDPEIGPWLGNEVGLFLGCVIVRVVAGARWPVWPNSGKRGRSSRMRQSPVGVSHVSQRR